MHLNKCIGIGAIGNKMHNIIHYNAMKNLSIKISKCSNVNHLPGFFIIHCNKIMMIFFIRQFKEHFIK
jgi:hypothetical protein